MRIVVSVIGIVICAASLTACKSDKQVAAEVAKSNVRAFQSSLDQIPGQIDKTMATLNTLTAGNINDRPKLLADYSRELRTLKTQALQVASERDTAERDVQRYFQAWVKESRGIKSESARNAAYKAIDADRSRTSVSMDYLRNGTRSFRELTDRLTEYETLLTKDMSPATISQVGNDYGRTLDAAIATKGYIARLNDQIDATLTTGKASS